MRTVHFYLLGVFLALYTKTTVAEVPVGVIIPYTGLFAKFGEVIREGINRADAKNISFHYEDEACAATTAIRAYKKLVHADSIKMFFGPLCGDSQSVIAPLLVGDDAIAVVGSAVPRRLFELSNGRMFSSQSNVEDESEFVAHTLNNRGLSDAAIAYVDNSFSRAHEAAFRGAFKGRVLDTLTLNSEDPSALKGLVLRIKTLRPMVLFVPDATPLVSGLLRELVQAGLADLPVYSVFAAESEDVRKLLPSGYNSLYYSYPAIGKRDALEFYPEQAIRMLAATTQQCGTHSECARAFLKHHYDFNAFGAITVPFEIRRLRSTN